MSVRAKSPLPPATRRTAAPAPPVRASEPDRQPPAVETPGPLAGHDFAALAIGAAPPAGDPRPDASDGGSRRDAATARTATAHAARPADPREALTQSLLRELAPALGFDPQRIHITWDDAARQRTESLHARGVMDRGRVLLHPRHYLPHTPAGRSLLAHELAHLTQQQERQLVPGGARPNTRAAEAEADVIGEAFAQRAPVRPTRATLPAGAVATREDTPGWTMAEERSALAAAVQGTRQSEIHAIRKKLQTGLFDWWVSDGEIEEILSILAGFPWVTARAIIEALPAEQRWTIADNVDASHWKLFRLQLFAVYAALSPADKGRLSSDRFEGMSLYGFSDEEHFALHQIWDGLNEEVRVKVTEAIAKLATTEKQQAAWRELLTSEIHYDERLALQAASAQEAEEKQKRDARRAVLEKDGLHQHIARWKQILDGFIVTDGEAMQVLDEIGAYENNPGTVEAIGQALEEAGLLDDLIDNLPGQRIFEETRAGAGHAAPPDRRKILLMLASVRPPHENLELAKKFLSYGIIDWAVTSGEAFLAFQLVKVLPPGSQRVFFGADGGKFATRLDTNMSQSMREGATMNFYTGGKDQGDLKSIQVQLLDDALWTPDASGQLPKLGRLEALIRMAIAAGEHEWVFAQSERRHGLLKRQGLYDEDPFNARIVEKFRLFQSHGEDEEGNVYRRETFEPEVLEGVPLGDEILEGIGQIPVLGSTINFVPYLGKIIKFLWSSDGGRVLGSLFTESIGGNRLDLAEMQNLLGGNFFGARLKPATRRRRRQRKKGPTENVDVNYAAARWDLTQGRLEATVDELQIAAINYPLETMKFQTGEGFATGLHVEIGYATPQNQQSPYLDLHVDRLELHDILVIFPDGMQAVNRAEVDTLGLRMGARSTDFEKLPKPSRDIDLGALLILPILGKFTSIPVLSRGRPTVPEAGSHMATGLVEPMLPMDLQFSAGHTVLEGMATSSGQYIASITLEGLSLRGGESLEAYRHAVETTLAEHEVRIAETKAALEQAVGDDQWHALTARLQRLEHVRDLVSHELDAARAREGELTVLRAKAEEELTPVEKTRLRELRGGVLLDIGELHIKGIEGLANLEDLHLTAVHGQGSSLAGALSLLSPNETLARMLKGETYQPVITGRSREELGFSLDLGTFETGPIALRDSVPTLAEVEEQLRKLKAKSEAHPKDVGLVQQRLRLEERRDTVQQYERLLKNGVGALTREEERTVVALREKILRGSGLEIDKIKAVGATLELGPVALQEGVASLQRAGLTADELTISGIRLPGQGTEIDLITGTKASLLYDQRVEGGQLLVRGEKLGVSGVVQSRSRELLVKEREVLFEQLRLRAPISLSLPAAAIEPLLQDAVTIRRELGQAYAEQHLAFSEGREDPEIDAKVHELEGMLEAWKLQAGYSRLKQDKARLGQSIARQHLAQSEGRDVPGLDDEIRALEARLRPIDAWLAQLDPDDLDLSHEITGLQIALPAKRRVEAIDGLLLELASYEEHLRNAERRLEQARESGKGVTEAEKDVEFMKFALDRWYKQSVLGGVAGEGINLEIDQLGNIFATDYDFADRFKKGLIIQGGVGPDGTRQPIAKKLTITDSRLPGLEADRIEVGHLRGRFTSNENQITFEKVGFMSLVLDQLQFHGWPHHVFSEGRSELTDMELDGTISMVTRETKTGEREWVPSHVHIQRLWVAEIAGDRLGYYNNDKNLHVEVAGGALQGLRVTDSHIDLPEEGGPKFDVHARIGQLEQFKLVGLLGERMRAQGVFDGRGVEVAYIDDGEKTLLTTDVEELSLTDGEAKIGSNKIRVSFKKLSGGLTLDEQGTVLLRNIEVQNLTVGPTIWAVGDTKVFIDQRAEFHGIKLDARIEMTGTGKSRKPKKIKVNHLRVNSAVLEGIRIQIAGKAEDPLAGTEATDPVAIDLKHAEAFRLFLEGENLLERNFTAEIQGDFGIEDLKVKVGEAGAESLKLGLSLEGSNMGGTLFGPDLSVIDLGNITKASGSFEGFGVNTSFETSEDFKLFSTITLKKDEINASAFTFGTFHIGPTTWQSEDGKKKIRLLSGDVTELELESIRLTYGKVPNKFGQDVSKLTGIVIEDLTIQTLAADDFHYEGQAIANDKKGDPVVNDTVLDAKKATLTHVQFKSIGANLLDKKYSLNLTDITKGQVAGVTAVLTSTFKDSSKTVLSVMTDVDADKIKANLTFNSIVTGTKDGQEQTWTSMDGTFHLDRFGLKSPNVKYTDEKGVVTTLGSLPGAAPGTVDVSGLDGTLAPNGSLLVEAEKIIGKNLQVKRGGITVDIPFAELTSFVAGLKQKNLDDGMELLGLKAKQLATRGLKITVEVDLTEKDEDASGKTPEDIIFEPAAGMEGDLYFGVKNVDVPTIPVFTGLAKIPITEGKIYAGDVDLMTYYGDLDSKGIQSFGQWLGTGILTPIADYGFGLTFADEGLDVDIPFVWGDWNKNVVPMKGWPGLHTQTFANGYFDLRGFIEGIRNIPEGDEADSGGGSTPLSDFYLESQGIKLGDGKAGTTNNFVDFAGKDKGKNVIKMPMTRLDKGLDMTSDELFMRRSQFEMGEGADKKAGSTGEISLHDVKVHIDLPDGTRTTLNIVVEVKNGTIQDIRFGDVAILDATKMRAEPKPEGVPAGP